MALLAISGRTGARSVPPVLPLARNDDSALRIIALHVLASAGGPDALAAVKAAVQDKDETVQDEAVRTLSTWPNNWPEDSGVAEPLLALAKSAAKTVPPGAGACAATCNTSRPTSSSRTTRSSAKSTTCCRSSSGPRRSAWPSPPSARHPDPGALEMLVTFAAEAGRRRRRLLRDRQARRGVRVGGSQGAAAKSAPVGGR